MTHEPDHTCWTVLRDAASGDAEARTEFARSYAPTIREYLSRRWRGQRLRDVIPDATQEVFIECLKPNGVLDRADERRGQFRGLLFTVTRNVARRFEERAAERGRIRPEDSAWLEQVASDDAGQATVFDRCWAENALRRAKALHVELAHTEGKSGKRRIELLERRFRDDQAIREIADEWGVAPRKLHNAYRKARTEFYRCLREVVAFDAPPGTDLDAECRRVLAALR